MGWEAEFRGKFALGLNEGKNCKFYESNTFLNLAFRLNSYNLAYNVYKIKIKLKY